MPSCGALLEIFAAGYYNPMFVRLARDSGIVAGRLYLSDSDPEADFAATQRLMKTNDSADHMRFVEIMTRNVEPSLADVADAIETLSVNRDRDR